MSLRGLTDIPHGRLALARHTLRLGSSFVLARSERSAEEAHDSLAPAIAAERQARQGRMRIFAGTYSCTKLIN